MATILFIIIALAAGIGLGAAILLVWQKSTARSEARTIIADANREAEIIKKDHQLEAEKEALRIKNEAEKSANQRLQKVQNEEQRIKQMNITMPLFLSSNGYAVVFDDFAAAEMVMSNPLVYTTESR
ncbi:MAG: Rnase Y domain-containing protein, partial [Duncaniella sp.]|nr:Rnase Y domain-containing protein [Duncaniella sp.]